VILVTGGTGFVGPKVVHALRAESRDVRCLVRGARKAATLRAWGCELVEGDVTDPVSLRQAVAGCEAVVHLVSIIAGRPDDFQRVMIKGTSDLIEAAQEAGVRRLVLMSALGTSEETRTLVPYFGAKWEMEQAVQSSGLEHVIFRPSFVFGRDGGVLPMFVRQVRWSPVVPVLGTGDGRLQPIWVDDVAAYFAKGVDLDAARNRTFELGGPDVVTWNELYDRIKKVLGKRRLSVHLPLRVVDAGAAIAQNLPAGRPPITRDQVKMLAAGDNVCDMAPALETFGIGVVPLDDQIRRAA
jgi:NADH dehydrogenase